jgi:hypothetical protein
MADYRCATGKIRFPDMGEARRQLSTLKQYGRIRRRGDEGLEPYWCTGCGGVHLGHAKPPDRRRMQREGRHDRRRR